MNTLSKDIWNRPSLGLATLLHVCPLKGSACMYAFVHLHPSGTVLPPSELF